MMSTLVEETHFLVKDTTHAVKQLSTDTCYEGPNVLVQNHRPMVPP
jgi:hypothetical protein